MKAKLKRIHSPDIDLDTYWPEDNSNFSFLLQAMIGPDDQEGEESFGIQVCTPAWLQSHYTKNDVLFGRYMMVVFNYDIDRIKSYIARYCDRYVGKTWQDVALQLSKIGQWEFEDYIPISETLLQTSEGTGIVESRA